MTLADVVLHHPLDHSPVGMEDRQPRAQLFGERVQIQFRAQLAVIALGGLLQAMFVGGQFVSARPGGAVDALELIVLLIPAPVGRRAAGQAVGGNVAGVRHVRAAAQIKPGHGIVALEVVVDGQFASPDLDAGTVVVRGVSLEPDELQLVRLVGQLLAGFVVTDDPATEPLALLDDLGHLLLCGLEVFGGEGFLDRKIVVEPVDDRRADAQLGVRMQGLDCLRCNVGGGVAQDGEPLGAAVEHRLDDVTVAEFAGQVLGLPVTAHGDDGLVLAEDL